MVGQVVLDLEFQPLAAVLGALLQAVQQVQEVVESSVPLPLTPELERHAAPKDSLQKLLASEEGAGWDLGSQQLLPMH
jgi:hypothetical protein